MRATNHPTAVGIDIGGSAVKGAAVDLATGSLAGERRHEAMPRPSTPDAVAAMVARIAGVHAVECPVGVTFPGIVRAGVIETAANLDRSWLGVDAAALFRHRIGRQVVVLNDADAAGIAEMQYGAGRGRGGVVMMITLGTGIGSALFVDGLLVPNTELGHIMVSGTDGERLAAASVRTASDLSWAAWATRLNAYLARLESLLPPDLVILGGGISRDHAAFLPRLRARAELVPAQLLNDAGVVGAALAGAAPSTEAPTATPQAAEVVR
jgi:polyphosphate glucokinase